MSSARCLQRTSLAVLMPRTGGGRRPRRRHSTANDPARGVLVMAQSGRPLLVDPSQTVSATVGMNPPEGPPVERDSQLNCKRRRMTRPREFPTFSTEVRAHG